MARGFIRRPMPHRPPPFFPKESHASTLDHHCPLFEIPPDMGRPVRPMRALLFHARSRRGRRRDHRLRRALRVFGRENAPLLHIQKTDSTPVRNVTASPCAIPCSQTIFPKGAPMHASSASADRLANIRIPTPINSIRRVGITPSPRRSARLHRIRFRTGLWRDEQRAGGHQSRCLPCRQAFEPR